MKKIIVFVCLGNICRSPMAEFLFKEIIERNKHKNEYQVLSAGTSGWNDGDDMHHKTKQILIANGINAEGFCSQKLTQNLFDKSDYIFVMDNQNFEDVVNSFSQNVKIKKVTDFCTKFTKYNEVPDPWLTDNFELVYQILFDALTNIYEKIENDLI